jgi:transcriptional regulator with XRE-family HTH domain
VELGWTQESLAESLGASVASVRRWEAGHSRPKPQLRGPLADKLQLTLPALERMLSANSPVALNGHAVPEWLTHYVSLEQAAGTLQIFDPATMPGLLQTPAYAEGVMRSHRVPLNDDGIRQQVDARLTRQAVLDRTPTPLELCCVIDESVLFRVTGSTDTMAEQLEHLVVMAARPTIKLQILPLTSSAIHNAWFGAFHLFTSEVASTPFMCCIDGLTGIYYQDSPQAIEEYVGVFDHLATIALSPEQSAELIQHRAEEYQKCRSTRN